MIRMRVSRGGVILSLLTLIFCVASQRPITASCPQLDPTRACYQLGDDNQVHYGSQILDNADVPSFKLLDPSYAGGFLAIDAAACGGEPCAHYAKDKTTVFYKTHREPGWDAESFRVLVGGYSIDRKQVYYLEKSFNADPMTFSVMTCSDGSVAGYGTDNQSVYFEGDVVDGSPDLTTFHCDSSARICDKYGCFSATHRLKTKSGS